MASDDLRLGAHMSISGGLDKAVGRGVAVGCTALQVFTKNANQWRAKPLGEDEIGRFTEALAASPIGADAVVAHDSYLINLGSPDEAKWEQSVAAFTDELCRCDQLGIPYLVTHPGAHMGTGEDVGLARVAAGLARALAASERTMVLLETTAGQGTALGYQFAHLGRLLTLTPAEFAGRVGVCLDTCHIFVAGYDLTTPEGYAATWAEFDREIGRDRLKVLHLNDAKKPLGSRVDRHEHLGKGHIGEAGFRQIMNDPALHDRLLLLETPKGDDCAEDRENMAFLRGLIA
ncbi:MAG: deoxyribonuclease IV [Thermomicrobiales bacterium]